MNYVTNCTEMDVTFVILYSLNVVFDSFTKERNVY